MRKSIDALATIREAIDDWAGTDADLTRHLMKIIRKFPGLEIDQDNIALETEEGLALLGRLIRKFGPEPTIFGGIAAPTIHECAALGSKSIYGCSGILVSKNVVLTAGHCVVSTATSYASRINNAEKVKNADSGVPLFGPHAWARDCTNDLVCKDDLAVVFLEGEIALSSFPPLASVELLAKAEIARMVGYGGVDISGLKRAGERREGIVPVLRGANVPSSVKYDQKTELVCGTTLLRRRQDACARDSGGGLYLWHEAEARWYFAGIISRGTNVDPYTCGGGSIHVLVETFLGRIDGKVAATRDYLGRPMEARQIKRP